MNPDVLTLKQAAELAAMPLAMMRRHAHAGVIPGTRIGRQWRFWRPTLLRTVAGVAEVPLTAPTQTQQVVDPRTLSYLLNLPEGTVCALMRQGAIPSVKVGGRWRAHWPTIQERLAGGLPLVEADHAQPAPISGAFAHEDVA